ncbi:MAG TPA: hypothetical protein VM493_08435 [Vicinamibacterales bacterium]|jgi:phage gp29-like protein|nr:hypothetical protein [Vicinamibacterales bacterium]
MGETLAPIMALAESATDLVDLTAKLYELYPQMPMEFMVALAERAFFVAELYGRLSVQEEAKRGESQEDSDAE